MVNPIAWREKILVSERTQKETHAGLWFDKYLASQERDKKESRGEHVKEVAALPVPSVYHTYFEQWQETLATLGDQVQIRRARTKGRMIVGLGSESILETSIHLHRTYGVPYIPGSALKGLAATYARLYLDPDWKQGGKYYKIIFGNTDDAGYLTFFDALYIPGSCQDDKPLVPDVITVHHEHYYQRKGHAPTDRDDPNPVPLLSATGAYLLALAAPDLRSPDGWLAITFQVLEQALKTLGIGAKTSSGYGRMTLDPPPVKSVDPDIKKAEGQIRELDAMKDVAGQIHGYYQKWGQLTSQEARLLLARAIIEKVRKAGREKVTAEKAWYKELLGFLDQFGGTR